MSVRACFYKVDEEKVEMIEHQFDIVNVNNWAWCYALKHDYQMLH